LPEAPAQSEASALRGNLIFAGVAAVTLGVLIAVVVLAGSGGKSNAAPAPRECMRSWNSDQSALADGRHVALAHHYTEAQLGYMDADGAGSISNDPNGRECVVVFASTTLDPEVEYAGQIRAEWRLDPAERGGRAAGAGRAAKCRLRRCQRQTHSRGETEAVNGRRPEQDSNLRPTP
jgi:hypothetical protein